MANFKTVKLAGNRALEELQVCRAAYRISGEYPFLIGNADDLELVQEAAESNDCDFDEIIRHSMNLDLENWLGERREEAAEYEFSMEETQGDWPGEVDEKGAIGLHKDILTGEIKPEVFLGLAKIAEPWQLPAALSYGGWNECPEAETHCAFFRKWQAEFGAEIVGMSGDVVECVVKNPPQTKEAAMDLAWQQYWYCSDIVEQGCGSVSNLGATLINSDYWYFWWD